MMQLGFACNSLLDMFLIKKILIEIERVVSNMPIEESRAALYC